jgi:hypothetical protein
MTFLTVATRSGLWVVVLVVAPEVSTPVAEPVEPDDDDDDDNPSVTRELPGSVTLVLVDDDGTTVGATEVESPHSDTIMERLMLRERLPVNNVRLSWW